MSPLFLQLVVAVEDVVDPVSKQSILDLMERKTALQIKNVSAKRLSIKRLFHLCSTDHGLFLYNC